MNNSRRGPKKGLPRVLYDEEWFEQVDDERRAITLNVSQKDFQWVEINDDPNWDEDEVEWDDNTGNWGGGVGGQYGGDGGGRRQYEAARYGGRGQYEGYGGRGQYEGYGGRQYEGYDGRGYEEEW